MIGSANFEPQFSKMLSHTFKSKFSLFISRRILPKKLYLSISIVFWILSINAKDVCFLSCLVFAEYPQLCCVVWESKICTIWTFTEKVYWLLLLSMGCTLNYEMVILVMENISLPRIIFHKYDLSLIT